MEKGKAWESIHILCKSTSTQKEFKDGTDFQGVFKDKYIWKVGGYSSLRWDIRGRDISELRINRVLRMRSISFSIVIYRTDLITVHYCLLSRQLFVDKYINKSLSQLKKCSDISITILLFWFSHLVTGIVTSQTFLNHWDFYWTWDNFFIT